MINDNAGSHDCKNMTIPENMRLGYLVNISCLKREKLALYSFDFGDIDFCSCRHIVNFL